MVAAMMTQDPSNHCREYVGTGVKHPEDLLGKNGLLKQLTKDLVERVLEE